MTNTKDLEDEILDRLWSIRKHGAVFDPQKEFRDHPNIFSLKIHHGGLFTRPPIRKYLKGNISFIDMVDSDEFSVLELDLMVESIGYPKGEVMSFSYRVPGLGLDDGLRALGTDKDVLNLMKFTEDFKVIDLYIEHSQKEILTSFIQFKERIFQPSRVDMEEITDDGVQVNAIVKNMNGLRNARRKASLTWNANVESNVVEGNGLEAECDDPEDEDFVVDEAELIEDVEVDMEEFRCAVDTEVSEHEGNSDSDIEGEELGLDDFDSLSESEDPPAKKALKKKLNKERKRIQQNDPLAEPFYCDQDFANKEEVKVAMLKYVVASRRQLHIEKNDKKRFTVNYLGIKQNQNLSGVVGGGCNEDKGNKVKAGGSRKVKVGVSKVDASNASTSKVKKPRKKHPKPTCPFLLHVSIHKGKQTWKVKTFKKDHNCIPVRDLTLFTVSYISKQILETVAVNPTIPLRALQDQLEKKYKLRVSIMKVFRSKAMALKKINGDYSKQYELLRDYAVELVRCNLGTSVLIETEVEPNPHSPTRQFKRVYVCLKPLMEGFKICGRELLGLDGCFMKGPFPGQLLTAVGADSNNGIYPVAYALVETENLSSWTWFLSCLGDDLGLIRNSNFTFISDRQKGIIPALENVFPCAEHRFCLRHIHENMKQRWRSPTLKNLLWKCATSTTIPYFEKAMKEIKAEDQNCYDWLMKIPPKHWARAHFSGRSKCDVVLNNLCEVFNRQLIGGRDKPVITCLEFVRQYLMKRIVVMHNLIAKCEGPLTPKITRIFEDIKLQALNYTVEWNASSKFQVIGPSESQYVVDIEQRTCSCRSWELTGIPCRHAVAVNYNMANNFMPVDMPEAWVDRCYWVDTWKLVYGHTIDPINGVDMWTPTDCPTKLLPPKHHTQVGRPKKKRKKSADELRQIVKDGKLTKTGNTVACGKCGDMGHNQRTCTGQRAPVGDAAGP